MHPVRRHARNSQPVAVPLHTCILIHPERVFDCPRPGLPRPIREHSAGAARRPGECEAYTRLCPNAARAASPHRSALWLEFPRACGRGGPPSQVPSTGAPTRAREDGLPCRSVGGRVSVHGRPYRRADRLLVRPLTPREGAAPRSMCRSFRGTLRQVSSAGTAPVPRAPTRPGVRARRCAGVHQGLRTWCGEVHPAGRGGNSLALIP